MQFELPFQSTYKARKPLPRPQCSRPSISRAWAMSRPSLPTLLSTASPAILSKSLRSELRTLAILLEKMVPCAKHCVQGHILYFRLVTICSHPFQEPVVWEHAVTCNVNSAPSSLAQLRMGQGPAEGANGRKLVRSRFWL